MRNVANSLPITHDMINVYNQPGFGSLTATVGVPRRLACCKAKVCSVVYASQQRRHQKKNSTAVKGTLPCTYHDALHVESAQDEAASTAIGTQRSYHPAVLTYQAHTTDGTTRVVNFRAGFVQSTGHTYNENEGTGNISSPSFHRRIATNRLPIGYQ